MIDILLSSVFQRVINPLWWLAVIGGAITAFLAVGLLVLVGSLAA
ncbi:MAG: hypothetical protein ACT4OU_11475 [Hyphomicrobium sp.]